MAAGNGYGSATNQLRNPYGIDIDSSGNIYIADSDNQRIVKWAPGAISGTVVASGIYAWDIHVDSSGNIYSSDYSNRRVMKYTLESDGTYTATVVAGGNGNGSNNNQFSSPRGIHVDSSGNIYVADQSNHRVMKWASLGSEGTVVAGTGTSGQGTNQLSSPADVQVR